jgi:hypothetical protein
LQALLFVVDQKIGVPKYVHPYDSPDRDSHIVLHLREVGDGQRQRTNLQRPNLYLWQNCVFGMNGLASRYDRAARSGKRQLLGNIAEWSTIFALRGQRETAVALKNVFEKSGFDAARKLAATEQLAYLTNLRKTRYVSPSAFASLYAQLGNKEQALLWLEKAYEERDVMLPCLAFEYNPAFAILKDEPRFRAVAKKVRPPQ